MGIISETVISKSIFEFLVKHLVDIEEEKDLIVERVYADLYKEREQFLYIINDYIEKMEGYISSFKVSGNVPDICPFIIIGCNVEVEEINKKQKEKFTIVSPFYNDLDSRQKCVSFMSPIGRAFLFKEVNERAAVKNEEGSLVFKVNSIEIPKDKLL